MNRKNTILLLTCITLICAGVFVLAQTKQQIATKQDTNQNASVDKITNNSQQNSNRPNYKPKDGYVPDEETAIIIAVAVWKPIYGKEKIENEKPYKANLKNGVWTVTGSLPKGRKGGVAEAEISKDDGRILRIIHGK
jgi:Na+-translocating ferredoxin:NAD+ oxidoreductase RnfG subunit